MTSSDRSEQEWSPPIGRYEAVTCDANGVPVSAASGLVQIGDGGDGLVILRTMASEGEEPEVIGSFTVQEIMLAMFEADPIAFAAALAEGIEHAEQLLREEEDQ